MKAEVHVQLFGPAGTICLIAEHPEPAAIQAIQAKMMADDGYWSLVQKAVEVSEPPTLALLQSV